MSTSGPRVRRAMGGVAMTRAARAGIALCLAALVPGCGEDGADSSQAGGNRGASPAALTTPAPGGAPGVASGDASAPAVLPSRATPPGGEPADQPWFEEVAAERGLDFTHVSGHRGPYLMPEIMAGGGALLDVDDDGWLDAYLVQSGHLEGPRTAERPPNQLFRNRGDGHFVDVTADSGAGDRGYGMGVACGDVDGDGDVDLFVTNVGPDVLLLNDGRGRFTDDTLASGLGHSGWSTSAAFFDADADGNLDLYVAQYLVWSVGGELSCRNTMGRRDYCNPANYDSPALGVLYRGDGSGRFADVTESAGLRTPGSGLGVGTVDFDGDGRTDIFVANDGMPNLLWHNEGDGRFRDVAALAGCALDHSGQAKAGMGVALADADDDGDVDILVCNLDKQSDSFYLNQGGLFRDATARAGLALTSRPFTRFGVVLADLDLDGFLDLFQANGRVGQQSMSWSDDPFAEPNLLLAGLPDGRFAPLATADGTAAPPLATSRGLACGDVDNDGAPDLLVVNRDAPAHLYWNRARLNHPARGWIGLDVRDTRGAPALGAVVSFALGERRLRRDVLAAGSYLSSHDPRLLVGLGDATTVAGLEVRWPDGTSRSFGELPTGGWHVLRPEEGR